MGLAEKSDALVIVVSEERGSVSTFQNGKMQPREDRQALSTAIADHWRNTASMALELPGGINRRHMLTQMAASLGLAVFFWSTLIIAQGEVLEKVIAVPVEYTPAPAHLALVGERDEQIRLHLSGPKSDLAAIDPAALSVKIDLSKAIAGKQVFLVTANNMRLPRNVSLLDVVPSSIELTLAEIVEQEVAIKPQLVGKLSDTMKILSVEVSPAKIKVLSPLAARQKKPVSVMTTPIYLESIKSNTSIYCKIIAPPTVQPVAKSWPDVEVIIKVGN
jgi:diadenylate cyclase